jgi:hypothetical protein
MVFQHFKAWRLIVIAKPVFVIEQTAQDRAPLAFSNALTESRYAYAFKGCEQSNFTRSRIGTVTTYSISSGQIKFSQTDFRAIVHHVRTSRLVQGVAD